MANSLELETAREAVYNCLSPKLARPLGRGQAHSREEFTHAGGVFIAVELISESVGHGFCGSLIFSNMCRDLLSLGDSIGDPETL